MKTLIFSDLHAHNFKQFAKQKNGLNSRFAEIIDVLYQIRDLCVSNKVETVIFGGDMFHAHTNVEHDVYNLTKEAFNEICQVAPVISIAGQHDLQFKKGYKKEHVSFSAFTTIPNFYYLNNEKHITKNGLTIYGHSWVFDEEFNDIPFQTADIGIFHATIKNSDIGGYTLPNGITTEKIKNLYKLIVVGDIHKPFHGGNILIPGAPLQHNFNDEGQDRGCWIVDIEKNAFKFHKLNYTEFVTATVNDGNCYFRKKLEIIDIKKKEKNKKVTKELSTFKLESYIKQAKKSATYSDIGYELLNEVKYNSYTYLPLYITKIEIDNFMTFFGHHEFTFKKGISVIYGQTDTFDSNGAGKTNLFDAISWCQYGKATKKINAPEIINWDAGKDCCVTLYYTDGTIISRYLKHKKYKNSISINGVHYASLKEAKPIIDSMFGSSVLFQNMNYFSQENSELFTHMANAQKNTFFSDLLGFDKYLKAGKIARKQYNVFDNKVSTINTTLELRKEELTIRDSELKSVTTNYNNFIEEQQETIKKLNEQSAQITNEINDLDLLFLNTEKSKLQNLLDKTNIDFDFDKYSSVQNQLTKLKSEIGTAREVVSKWNIEIDKIKNNEASRCQVCFQPISSESKQGALIYLATLQESNRKKLEDLLSNLSPIVVQYDILKDEYVAYLEVKEKQKEWEQKLRNVTDQINALTIKRTKLEEQLKAVQNQLATIETKQNPYTQQVEDIKFTINTIQEKIIKQENKKGVLDDILDIYSFWITAFSTKTGSIISYILDECVALFNQEATIIANSILNDVIKVELVTAVKLKSSEDIVDKLDLKVYKQNGVTVSYEALSGGEKRRVDLVVFLTIGQIIKTMNGLEKYPFNFIVLDEAVSPLDELGKDSVIKLFSEYGAENLYLISHDSYSVSSADYEIFINKADGKSSILTM